MKTIKCIVSLILLCVMLFSLSSQAFAADKTVPLSGGQKCVYFTVQVDKTQKTLPEKWPDASYDTKNLSKIEVVLKLPSNYSDTGAPVQVLMFGEGFGQYITDSHGQGAWASQFTKAGYAVFEVDNLENMNQGIKDLGAPAKVRAAMKAFDYIKENYNVLPKFIPIGVSNGTLLALEIMDWYPEYVSCGIIGGPNVSLEESYKASDNWGTKINSAALYYNFSNKANYYASSAHNRGTGEYDKDIGLKYDFYGHMYSKDGVNYLDKEIPPVLFCIGASEPATPRKNALEVANALKNSGNTVVLKEYAGTGHGDVCSLSRTDINKDVLDFIATYKSSNCKHTNVKKTPAVKASCVQKGYSEGSCCADCGKVITAQKEYPLTAHQYGPEPTCSEPQVCIYCNMIYKAATYRHVYSGEWLKDGDVEYRKCETCNTRQYRKEGEVLSDTGNNTSSGSDTVGDNNNSQSNNTIGSTNNSTTQNSNANNEGNSLLVPIILGVGGAVVLVAAAIVVVLLVLKKKSKIEE